MGNLIGHGRYKTSGYPGTGGAAGAATAAFRNRNVAQTTVLTVPFVPETVGSLIAGVLFTPRVSGIIQVAATVLLKNGAVADTYALVAFVLPGLSLTMTGGEVTSDGWVMGSNTPPVLGGTPGTSALNIEDLTTLGTDENGSLSVFGISAPLSTDDAPVAVVIELAQVGGTHQVALLGIANLSVMELP